MGMDGRREEEWAESHTGECGREVEKKNRRMARKDREEEGEKAMQNIWSIAGAILASFGGAAVIIGTAIKFASSQIAEALQKKYEYSLEKELEDHKSKLEGKEYVSKAYFDREMQIYQEVSRTTFEMVRDISVMIPSGYTTVPANRKERLEVDKEHYKKAYNSLVAAQDTLNCNAPFISEAIFDICQEIRHLCTLQLNEYQNRFIVTDLRPQEEKERFSFEAYQRTDEINKKYKDFTKQVRDYLKNLEIY